MKKITYTEIESFIIEYVDNASKREIVDLYNSIVCEPVDSDNIDWEDKKDE